MASGVTFCGGCGWKAGGPVAGPGQNPYAGGPAPGYKPPAPDLGTRMLLPVGRSPFAIIAGYLGLLSPLVIFAPFAILFAGLAIWDMKKNPEKSGMGRAIFGLVMGIGGCLLIPILAMSGRR
ncbi:MAG: hypothetical protein QM811_22960 [Pirellulales bacterium]